VTSRGDRSNTANENYARELCELFCLGVDTVMTRAISSRCRACLDRVRIRLVDATNEFNPFAPQSTTIVPGSTNTSTTTDLESGGSLGVQLPGGPAQHEPQTLFGRQDRSRPRFGPPYTPGLRHQHDPASNQFVIPADETDGIRRLPTPSRAGDLPFRRSISA